MVVEIDPTIGDVYGVYAEGEDTAWNGDASYNLKEGLDWDRIKAEHDARLIAQGGEEVLKASQQRALEIQASFNRPRRGSSKAAIRPLGAS